MPDNKSHHFVPQFLLRRFASDSGRRHTCMFRIAARLHHQRVSIRDQCAKDYFYGKHLAIEQMFGRLETAASAVIGRIVEQEELPEPESEEMVHFLMFVIFQVARTPAEVARSDARSTAFLRQVMKSHPRLPEKVRAALDKVEVKATEGVLQSIQFAAMHAPVAADLSFKVLRNRTETEFVIGDAPAVLHNQWRRPIKEEGSTGLACAGLQILLPLSPRYLAVFYDGEVYTVGEPRQDVVDVTNPEEVRRFNTLQFASADHALYYSSENTAAHVDGLPGTARTNRGGFTSGRYAEDGGGSTLVAITHIPLEVDLIAGAMRMRYEAYMAPLSDRVQQWRPEAFAMAKLVAPRRSNSPPKRTGSGRFTRVPD
jgi:hypothetical protein